MSSSSAMKISAIATLLCVVRVNISLSIGRPIALVTAWRGALGLEGGECNRSVDRLPCAPIRSAKLIALRALGVMRPSLLTVSQCASQRTIVQNANPMLTL